MSRGGLAAAPHHTACMVNTPVTIEAHCLAEGTGSGRDDAGRIRWDDGGAGRSLRAARQPATGDGAARTSAIFSQRHRRDPDDGRGLWADPGGLPLPTPSTAPSAPSRAAARPASISTGCATRSAASALDDGRQRGHARLGLDPLRAPERQSRRPPWKLSSPASSPPSSGGWSDKTQLLAAMLAAADAAAGPVLAGLSLAALASNIVAAFAGIWIAGDDHDPRDDPADRARLALRRRLRPHSAPAGAGGGSALAAPLHHLHPLPRGRKGDRTQFLTFALAGRFDSAPLAAAGATAGWSRPAFPRSCLASGCRPRCRCARIRWAVAASC